MQFNFWWFTSSATTNILIATAIWFVLFIVCQRTCAKDQEIQPMVYIAYGIASFGAGMYSVLGVYGGLMGPAIALFGFILAIILQRATQSSPGGYSEASVREATPRVPRTTPSTEISTAACPDCGAVVQVTGVTMKPDGSVVCTKCYKKFVP